MRPKQRLGRALVKRNRDNPWAAVEAILDLDRVDDAESGAAYFGESRESRAAIYLLLSLKAPWSRCYT